ncbi:MAG: RHS repeat protein [Eubacterium sp.]|nr:RHS repeat protein [Eubacterium sp.]
MKQRKFMQKAARKVVSFVLIVALALTGVDLRIEPKLVDAAEKIVENNKKLEKNVKIVKELVNERTENSNTYLLSDGSKKTKIYSENIRYKEKGKLVDYDPVLIELNSVHKKRLCKIADGVSVDDYAVVNAKGDSRQYFPKQFNDNSGVVMNHGKYTLEFIPISVEENKSIKEHENEKSVGKKKVAEGYTSEVIDDMITYSSNTNNVKYQYISLPKGVKENIILYSRPETNEFAFRINTKEIELEYIEGYKGINLKDISTGKNIGYIMPPNITDGEGKINYEDVKYVLEEYAEYTVLKLVVSKKYFENNDLVYPVKIDPTPVWFDNTLSTAIICSASVMAGSNLHGEELFVNNKTGVRYPFVGSEQRVLLDTSKVAEGNCFIQGPGLFKGKYIEKAELSVAETAPQYTPGTIEIRKLKSKWNPQTVTWNNQPEMEEEVIGSFVCKGKENTRHSIDLTEWAQSIADGEEDRGFVFTAKEEGTGAGIKGPEVSHQGYMWLSVTYCDMSSYDGTVQMSADYNEKSGKMEIKVLDYDQRNEGKTVSSYQVFARKGESDKFVRLKSNSDIEEISKIETDEIQTTVDYRVCVAYSDGTVMPSNIVSFQKEKNDKNTSVFYEQISMDTDGDGIEDGYEIWDFKTKWNEKDADGNYILDSDGDGLTDAYEVFYQGSNPAVTENFAEDSDGDGLTDIEEYRRGTDPHLADSDFDGINDLNDYGSTNPRKTDNPDKNGIDQAEAYAASVYMGPYDKEYSEVKDGVKYSYIKNIYGGEIKQIRYDYGDSSLNKTVKYFYDGEGNNTAVIEQYDSEFDPEHNQTVCVTYTYEKNNIVFICDRATKYTMTYDNDKLKSLKIGDKEIVNYNNSLYVDNIEDSSSLDFGSLIKFGETKVNYGNGQKTKTVLYRYKRADNDFTSTAYEADIFDESNKKLYCIEYNIEGKLLKIREISEEPDKAVTYEYSYENGNTTVTRNDGFTKNVTKQESIDEQTGTHSSTTTTKYTYKDINGVTKTRSSSLVSHIDKNDRVSTTVNLNNKDKYQRSADAVNRMVTERIFDEKNNDILNMMQIKQNKSLITRFIKDIKGDSVSDIDYIYDLAGNLVQIKNDGKIVNRYSYNPHGRMLEENDYANHKSYIYEYDALGNICDKIEYSLDSNGNKILTSKQVTKYEYNNEQCANLLTAVDGGSKRDEITYDDSGNPINFIDGKKLTWTRGRLLEKINYNSASGVTYKYNQDGYRIYKSTANAANTHGVITYYEWDEDKLIYEKNTDLATSKTYEIWYLYDDKESMIGYDYTYIDSYNAVKTKRVYYEKDIQGSVVGLLDDTGHKIATYSYDAFGNLVSSTSEPLRYNVVGVNHIGYKGYYRDDESGFYYLGKSYYVPKICRMLNLDEPTDILEKEKNIRNKWLGPNDSTYSNAGIIPLPIDATGYGVSLTKEIVDDKNVKLCETSSLLFESMNTFITNCYGFVINCWTFERDSGTNPRIYPGIFTDDIDHYYYNKYISCEKVAENVKKDINFWEEEALILTGKDNNPYYETDDKHCLIAVRTMTKERYEKERYTDSYHFMIRKDDGWYFQSGWQIGTCKLVGNNNPNTVNWSQYFINDYGEYKIAYGTPQFYDSEIQYMVIPKMPLRIK